MKQEQLDSKGLEVIVNKVFPRTCKNEIGTVKEKCNYFNSWRKFE